MSVKNVLDWERSNVRYKEYGDNGTKFGNDFGWNYVSWCAIFQWDAAEHGGEKGKVPHTAGCEEMLGHFENLNQTSSNFQQAERGNLVFWDWNLNHSPNHVEMIESVDTDSAGRVVSVVTIGGNTGPNSQYVYRQRRAGTFFEAVARVRWSNWDTAWPGKLLVKGSDNWAVGRMQKKLGISSDNQFGPVTLVAVKKFQNAHHLTVDGQVGLKTWGAMFG